MSEAQLWLAVGTVAGSAITALFGGGTALLGMLLKYRRDRQQDQSGEQWKIIDRQEKQIARLEAQIQEQQTAIATIHGLHTECREESAQQWVYLQLLLDYAKRQHVAMGKAGIPCEPPPELPTAKTQHDDAGFVLRTTEQNTSLLTNVTDKLRQQQEGETSG